MSTKEPTLKERMITTKLFMDGFIEIVGKEVTINQEPLRLLRKYNDKAKEFNEVLISVAKGLAGMGYTVTTEGSNKVQDIFHDAESEGWNDTNITEKKLVKYLDGEKEDA